MPAIAMTNLPYRETIADLGLTIESAADFLGIGARQSARYAAESRVPVAVAMLLRLMAAYRLNPAHVTTLTAPLPDPEQSSRRLRELAMAEYRRR